MKFLSFLEYQTENNVYQLARTLSDLGIPKRQFILTALGIAKSVQHLVAKSEKVSANRCIETVEKFLRGEATTEDCRNASYSASASSASSARASAAAEAAIYAVNTASNPIVNASSDSASAASCAAVSAGSSSSYAADLFREYLPWDLVCGYQIAKVLKRVEDIGFIFRVSKNKKLVDYATMIISEPSMHQNFKFFMVEFLKKVMK